MFEIDFLPVDCETTAGSVKSGDAIAVRFTDSVDGQLKVVVIDAGFQTTGERMVEHIRQHYYTNRVNLMVSTHPDGDHLNGLRSVIEQLQVDELMIHQPRQHAGRRVSQFRNLGSIDALIAVARAHNTRISDPFTGTDRFNGQLLVLGPEKDLYEQLVEEHLDTMAVGESKSLNFSTLKSRARNLLDSAIGTLPTEETLTNLGVTDPRNETSVITLLRIDGQRLLFTGDAGLRALPAAADEYECFVGAFRQNPLQFFQAPHHGSRRNLGPDILNRLLGSREFPHGDLISLIAAAAAAPKHPSPQVVNALQRRGATVVATLGQSVRWGNDAPARFGWGPATPLPPLDESGEVDD